MSPPAPTAATIPAAGFGAALRREFRLGEPGSLRAHLIRGAGGSIALRVVNMLLSVVIGIVLARSLGASGYGIYAFAFAWLELLKVPTQLGMPALVTREVAVCRARGDWGGLRGLLLRANQAVLAASLIVVLLAGGVSWLLFETLADPQALTTFWLALGLLPLFGLTSLRQACLRGLHRVVLSEVPDAVARPVLFLTLIGAVWLLEIRSLTPALTMVLQLVAVGFASMLGAFWLIRSLPAEMNNATPVYRTRSWVSSALPFLLTGGLTFINGQTDIIMLGWFGEAADVGIYRVACLGAGLVAFGFAAVHHVVGPSIAQLHADGDAARLQFVITRAAWVVLAVSLPVALLLILFGERLLAGVFGAEYAAGAACLAILAIGQLVSAGLGLSALLLDMTGNERETAKNIAFSAFLNVALNALLIPLWRIEGAALASFLSLAVSNLLLVITARRRLGLYSSVFRPIQASRERPAESDLP